MLNNASGRQPYLFAMDGLRGIAALSVFLVHINYVMGERMLIPFGYLAVDLFFLMSGYVVAFRYEMSLLNGMPWKKFMFYRIGRLYPTMILSVMLGFLVYFLLPANPYCLQWYSLPGHLLLIPDLHSNELFPLNGVLWTLFFEVWINAAHGAVLRWLTNTRLICVVLIGVLIWWLTAYSSGNWGGGWQRGSFTIGLARVICSYGIGVLLYRCISLGKVLLPAVPAWIPLVLSASLLFAPASFIPGYLRIPLTIFIFFPVSVSMAVVAKHSDRHRPFRLIGATAYPLYLLHLPLLLLAQKQIAQIGEEWRTFAWITVVLSIIACSVLVEYSYDGPLRRRFGRRYKSA